MSETSDSRYTSVAIWLHWLIAFFIIMNLVMGLFLDDIKGPERYYFMTIHVSAGLSVLVLTVVRVFWRLLNAPPPYPDDMPAIEKATAHVAHFLLYAAMVIVPLTGWIMGSANPPAGSEGYRYAKYVRMIQQETGQQIKPVSEEIIVVPEDFTVPEVNWLKLWFVAPLPNVELVRQIGAKVTGLEAQKVIHDEFEAWHEISSYLLIGLLLLHILASLKHQVIDKHHEFQRMWIKRNE